MFNMRNEDHRKQLCMQTLSAVDALHFAVARERRELPYNRVPQNHSEKVLIIAGKTRQMVNRLGILKKTANEIKGRSVNNFLICENWLKPNQ